MKQITVVVKPFRAEAVLRAIADLDVIACVAQEAKGYSRQKGYLDRYVGSEYSMAFLPKVEINVWVNDDKAEEAANRIVKSARTGRIGDGKVFVVTMGWPESLEFSGPAVPVLFVVCVLGVLSAEIYRPSKLADLPVLNLQSPRINPHLQLANRVLL